jgi:NifB/MoaA-like Fe-S oxidoreductase
MLRQLLDEMPRIRVPSPLRGKSLQLVTGRLARPYIEILARHLGDRGVRTDVTAVENTLLGRTVTVSGLLPGKAVLDTLQRLPERDAVVLPPDMVNTDCLTLDDVHVSEMEGELGVPVVVGEQTIGATLKKVSSRLTGR